MKQYFVLIITTLIIVSSQLSGRSLNTILPVGTTAGQFDVSGTGGATYSVPIEVPPGTAGMQPSLAVVYNSQGGNGIMGLGWNLAGLSTITRTGSDYYHEGYQEGVKISTSDHYMLDGNRLIYSSTDGFYRTENETFSKIIISTDPYGPNYFTVYTKDGMIIEYGNTADSKIEAQGKYGALCWLINKISDGKGNYMTFTYTEDKTNWEYRIKEINYTGNAGAGLATYNKVQFVYEDRTDVTKGYIYGSQVMMTKRLKNIITQCEGTKVKDYIFNYTVDGYSHLNEIFEYGFVSASDSARYNSILASWGTRTPSLQTTTNAVNGSALYFPGDFNGDGQTDLLGCYPYEWDIRLANPNGTSFSIENGAFYDTFTGAYAADLNGDGKDDVIISQCTENGYSYSFYISNATGHTKSSDSIGYSEDHVLLTGDFNGDGLADCIVADPYNDRWYMYSYSYSGGILSPLAKRDSGTSVNWEWSVYSEIKRIPIDFNGNGRQDILIVHASGYEIYEYNGTDFVLLVQGTDFNYNDIITCGDYNGDGNTDLYIFDPYQTTGYGKIKYSTGAGFTDVTLTMFNSFLWQYNNFYSQDMNGDGLLDLVVIGRGTATTGSAKIYVSLSTGTGFGSYVLYTPSQTLAVSGAYNYFGDFNGDGNPEFFYIENDATPVTYLYSLYRGKANSLVQSFTNGLNSITNITYKPMTDDNSFYTKGSLATFPVNDIQIPMYMVSSASAGNCTGTVNTVNYTYQAAKFHRQGKGFLGIGGMLVTDQTTNTKTTITNTLNTSFYFYAPSTTLTETTGGTDISGAAYTNAVKDFGSKRIWPYVTQVINADYLKGVSVYKNYTYNPSDLNYGNLTSEKTSQNGDPYNYLLNSYIYVQAGAWCPSKISYATTTRKEYQQTDYARTIYNTYYGDGWLFTRVADPGKSKVVTTTYTYDNCGNPLTITLSASGLTDRTTTMTYDSKYRLPLTKKNDLNHTFTYTYNYKFGVVTQETDPNNNITTNTPDRFGKVLTTTLPTGKVINKTLAWPTGGVPANGLFTLTTTSDSSPTVTEYHDTLGRVIQTVIVGFNSNNIYANTEYFPSGNQKRACEPYFNGETQQWTRYVYDAYQRIDSIITPANKVNYDYSGLTVTTTKLCPACSTQTFTKTYDWEGKLTQATDAGGTISYTYYVSGLVNTITAAGATTSMEYDEYGNQNKLTDPDAGVYKYYYNAYHELIAQKGPKSSQDSAYIVYDVLGRVTTKQIQEGNITYTYDNATKGTGMLASLASYYGSASYSYDTYSRLNSYTETIDGTGYTTSYKYGKKLVDMLQMTYPSGFIIKQEFDANGYLKKIKRSDNTSIWECRDVNSKGQIEEMLYGNNLTTYQTFDNFGYPMAITTQNAGGTKIQDLGYNFNAGSGNLTWRKDNLTGRNNITENFIYDNLDRLTRSTIGSDTNHVNYFENGNISYKTDGGTAYDYNENNRPHAVNSITGYLGSGATQKIGYYSFNKAKYISENLDSVYFYYGYDNERRKMLYYNNRVLSKTTYYLGNYENEVYGSNTRQMNYITSPAGVIAIFVQNGQDTMYYIHKDYLGSWLCITSQTGQLLEERSFDAWGRRRNPTNWTFTSIPSYAKYFTRGYTTHEHLDKFALINMNGRMYDPIVGRFLSTDNYVLNPLSTQPYNRYSYCLNNPLRYTDPTGYMPKFLKEFIKTVAEITVLAVCTVGGTYGGIALGAALTDNPTGMIIGGIVGLAVGCYVAAKINSYIEKW